MNYYKNSNGDVFAYNDIQAVPSGLTQLTEAEVQEHLHPTPSLDEVKTRKTSSLSADCQAEIYAGFHSSALGEDHLYPTKDTDQQNLASSVLASLLPGVDDTWTTPFWCADSSGVWASRDHTAAQIQQVGIDVKARILACMAQNATLAAQVQTATTVEAVEAIEWTSPT